MLRAADGTSSCRPRLREAEGLLTVAARGRFSCSVMAVGVGSLLQQDRQRWRGGLEGGVGWLVAGSVTAEGSRGEQPVW